MLLRKSKKISPKGLQREQEEISEQLHQKNQKLANDINALAEKVRKYEEDMD